MMSTTHMWMWLTGVTAPWAAVFRRGGSAWTELVRDCVLQGRTGYAAVTKCCLPSLLHSFAISMSTPQEREQEELHTKLQCFLLQTTQVFLMFHCLKDVLLSSSFKELCTQRSRSLDRLWLWVISPTVVYLEKVRVKLNWRQFSYDGRG